MIGVIHYMWMRNHTVPIDSGRYLMNTWKNWARAERQKERRFCGRLDWWVMSSLKRPCISPDIEIHLVSVMGQPSMGTIQVLRPPAAGSTSDWQTQAMFLWVHEAIRPLGTYQLVTEHCEGWKLALLPNVGLFQKPPWLEDTPMA